MAQPKLCIFDLDGTLVDTLQDIAHAVNRVLIQLNFPPLPLDEIEGYIGQGARWLLTCALKSSGDPDASLLSEARQLFLPTYAAHISDHSLPFPGVIEVLTELQGQGHILTVCTNKPYDLAIPLLQNLNLAHFFQATLGGDSLEKKKPDPMPLLHLMKQCNTSPSHTIMIGDTIYDILAGKNANTTTCGISYDNKRKEQLLNAGADLVVREFHDVGNFICSEFRDSLF